MKKSIINFASTYILASAISADPDFWRTLFGWRCHFCTVCRDCNLQLLQPSPAPRDRGCHVDDGQVTRNSGENVGEKQPTENPQGGLGQHEAAAKSAKGPKRSKIADWAWAIRLWTDATRGGVIFPKPSLVHALKESISIWTASFDINHEFGWSLDGEMVPFRSRSPNEPSFWRRGLCPGDVIFEPHGHCDQLPVQNNQQSSKMQDLKWPKALKPQSKWRHQKHLYSKNDNLRPEGPTLCQLEAISFEAHFQNGKYQKFETVYTHLAHSWRLRTGPVASSAVELNPWTKLLKFIGFHPSSWQPVLEYHDSWFQGIGITKPVDVRMPNHPTETAGNEWKWSYKPSCLQQSWWVLWLSKFP